MQATHVGEYIKRAKTRIVFQVDVVFKNVMYI